MLGDKSNNVPKMGKAPETPERPIFKKQKIIEVYGIEQ